MAMTLSVPGRLGAAPDGGNGSAGFLPPASSRTPSCFARSRAASVTTVPGGTLMVFSPLREAARIVCSEINCFAISCQGGCLRFCRLGGISRLNDIQPHRRSAGADELERLGGSERKIDDAIVLKRTTVVNPHDDGFAGQRVCHTNLCIERKRAMGGGHSIHIVRLAVGGPFSVKLFGVVRCDTLLGTGGCMR